MMVPNMYLHTAIYNDRAQVSCAKCFLEVASPSTVVVEFLCGQFLRNCTTHCIHYIFHISESSIQIDIYVRTYYEYTMVPNMHLRIAIYIDRAQVSCAECFLEVASLSTVVVEFLCGKCMKNYATHCVNHIFRISASHICKYRQS